MDKSYVKIPKILEGTCLTILEDLGFGRLHTCHRALVQKVEYTFIRNSTL